MKYLSVCSGIEAATVAWHGLGWKAAAYSEIEAFPSAVLAHHYPDVSNVGDMTKFKEWNIEPGTIDLLVGGTPCQSFSVAGLRKGLADPRGNLALVYCGILDHLKPRWFVWENVPGVLSSGGGRDFGSFLGAVAELGYGFAYRVLDAQFFGVAQRRRRVFVVGYLGDWRPAAKVLFERESLRGDSAPSREAGKAVAGRVTHGLGVSGECARALTAAHTATGRLDPHEATFVSQPIALQDITPREKAQNGRGWNDDGTAYTVDTAATQGVAMPVVFDTTQVTSPSNYSNPKPGDPCHPLAAGAHAPAVALNIYGGNKRADRPDGGFYVRMNEETSKTLDAASGLNPTCSQGGTAVLAPTLTASNDPSRSPQSSEITAQVAAVVQATAAVAVALQDVRAMNKTQNGPGWNDDGTAYTLDTQATQGVATAMQVRRLTPVECERLQGFPDNYTAIPWRGKADTPDGPRYKALGNSMAVPVMAWIGKRIQESEAGNAS